MVDFAFFISFQRNFLIPNTPSLTDFSHSFLFNRSIAVLDVPIVITFPVTITDVLLECPHYPQFRRQCRQQSSLPFILSESPTAVKQLL